MSNKPKIYATCPAGCLWETVHKDDLNELAYCVKQVVGGGKYGLVVGKTCRAWNENHSADEWGFTADLVVQYITTTVVKTDTYAIELPEFDKFSQGVKFKLLGVDFFESFVSNGAATWSGKMILEINDERYEYVVGTTGTVDGYGNAVPMTAKPKIVLEGITNCVLYNEDSTITACNGDSVFILYAKDSTGMDASEYWKEGLKYIGIYVGQEAPEDSSVYQWMKFIGDDGDGSGGSADTSDLETRIEALENQLYEAISITSFSTSPAYFEKGSTVNAITLNWKTNKTPTALNLSCSMPLKETELNGDDTSAYVDYIAATVNNPVSFQLSATDEKGATATKSVSVTFCNGVYYGAAAEPTTYDSAFVLGLAKELRANKKPSFTANAGAGQYIYYCLPVSMGACTFSVGGFTGGFSLVKTISFTNASGYTENYYIYRSDNANLGNTSVTVS